MAKHKQSTGGIGEQLSDAVDDELGGSAARFMIRRLASDAELRQQWQRYHLIGDCLRGQYAGRDALGTSDAVAARLESEVAYSVEAAPGDSANSAGWRFLRPVAGVAVAATVAVVAVLGLRTQGPGSAADGIAAGERLAAPTTSIVAEAVQPASASPRRASVDAKLSRYLVRHNEMAPEGGRSGFVSYAHMVSSNSAGRAAEPQVTAPAAPDEEGAALTPGQASQADGEGSTQ